jgi:hypothetical protein
MVGTGSRLREDNKNYCGPIKYQTKSGAFKYQAAPFTVSVTRDLKNKSTYVKRKPKETSFRTAHAKIQEGATHPTSIEAGHAR